MFHGEVGAPIFGDNFVIIQPNQIVQSTTIYISFYLMSFPVEYFFNILFKNLEVITIPEQNQILKNVDFKNLPLKNIFFGSKYI